MKITKRLMDALHEDLYRAFFSERHTALDEQTRQVIHDAIAEYIDVITPHDYPFPQKPSELWHALPDSWFYPLSHMYVSPDGDRRIPAAARTPGRWYFSWHKTPTLLVPFQVAGFNVIDTIKLSDDCVARLVALHQGIAKWQEDLDDFQRWFESDIKPHRTTTSLFSLYPELQHFILEVHKKEVTKKRRLSADKQQVSVSAPDLKFKQLLSYVIQHEQEIAQN